MSEALFSALLSALCFTESNHQTLAINIHDGGSPSYGYCQIKYTTAKELGFKGYPSELWFNKNTNMYFAGLYLRKQIKRYNGNIAKAVAAYNAGSVKGEIKNTKYVSKVFVAMKERR